MSTWHREGPADAAELHGELLSVLQALPMAVRGSPLRVRNGETDGIAAIVDWSAVLKATDVEIELETPDAEYHRLALAPAASLSRASGLLRYGDLIGVIRAPGGPAPSPPQGLVACGHFAVKVGASETLRIDLFNAAPVDRGGFRMGAPVDFRDPEDLDARADWFKKRHDPD